MALITAATLRSEWFPSISGTGADTEIATFIDRAEQALAMYCGWPSVGGAPQLEQKTYTLYLSGPDILQHQVLPLVLRPVVSIASVYDDTNRAYGAASEVTEGTDFTLDADRGRLILTGTTSHAWSTGFEAIKVTGDFGLETGSIPDWAAEAVGLTVKANWDRRTTLNVDQAQTNGDARVFNKHERMYIPPEAKQLIQPAFLAERLMSGAIEVRFA